MQVLTLIHAIEGLLRFNVVWATIIVITWAARGA